MKPVDLNPQCYHAKTVSPTLVQYFLRQKQKNIKQNKKEDKEKIFLNDCFELAFPATITTDLFLFSTFHNKYEDSHV